MRISQISAAFSPPLCLQPPVCCLLHQPPLCPHPHPSCEGGTVPKEYQGGTSSQCCQWVLPMPKGVANGLCQQTLPMGAAKRHCQWVPSTCTTKRCCQWVLLMAAASANRHCRWMLPMGTANMHCQWALPTGTANTTGTVNKCCQ